MRRRSPMPDPDRPLASAGVCLANRGRNPVDRQGGTPSCLRCTSLVSRTHQARWPATGIGSMVGLLHTFVPRVHVITIVCDHDELFKAQRSECHTTRGLFGFVYQFCKQSRGNPSKLYDSYFWESVAFNLGSHYNYTFTIIYSYPSPKYFEN